MLKISTAVGAILNEKSSLYFAFYHRLLNLSQVARFIQPLVAARTQKEVQVSAVLMCLSRLQNRLRDERPNREIRFFLDKITVHTGLCSMTLIKTNHTHRILNQTFTSIQSKGGFITITEGVSEITAILEQENLAVLQEQLGKEPFHLNGNLAAVGVRFTEKYVTSSGLLYQLLQQLALQNINVIEIASTRTEFNIYLDEADVHPAFDSIYNRFARRGKVRWI